MKIKLIWGESAAKLYVYKQTLQNNDSLHEEARTSNSMV